jgi:membrane associated rhomboid family serine protease
LNIAIIVFYLLCGLVAAFAQIAVGPNSDIPNIGASGAIAGVLGAYLLLFPRAEVQTLVFLGFFVRLVRLPALLFLGLWFVLQLFSGVAGLGMEATGGVAWFAHIGGFIAGIVLINIFRRR